MDDDVGTCCVTTNATPETSFAPRPGMVPGGQRTETGHDTSVDAFVMIRYQANAPGYAG